MEQWKDIPGYEGRYQVSNKGRVKTLRNVIPHPRNPEKTRVNPEKVMSNCLDSKGYYYVTLRKDGKRKNHRVHRLVCEAFVSPAPEPGLDVCHNDGSRTNNLPENLRWGTRSENIKDAVDHGTHYWTSKAECKRGHELGGKNRREKDRECLACNRATATVRYHKDLRGRIDEVADIHYRNIQGDNRRLRRSDFPQ